MFDLKSELLAAIKSQESRRSTPLAAVRGGNSSFETAEGIPLANDAGQCPRASFLRSKGIQSTPDFKSQMTFNLGFAFERFFEQLRYSPKVEKLETQVAITSPIEGSTVPFNGTADFIITFKGGYKILADTKSVSSTRSFKDVFTDHKIKPQYIAQLVSYMEVTKINHGLLVFGAFGYTPKAYLTAGTQRDIGRTVEPDLLAFNIILQGEKIIIEGEEYKYSLTDIKRHRETVARAIETDTVPLIRPLPYDPEGYQPCGLCPFKTVCMEWEMQGTRDTESFVTLAKEAIK